MVFFSTWYSLSVFLFPVSHNNLLLLMKIIVMSMCLHQTSNINIFLQWKWMAISIQRRGKTNENKSALFCHFSNKMTGEISFLGKIRSKKCQSEKNCEKKTTVKRTLINGYGMVVLERAKSSPNLDGNIFFAKFAGMMHGPVEIKAGWNESFQV